MRITSKAQVTIPAEIRERAGLLPHTEVEFEFDGKVLRLVRARPLKSMVAALALSPICGAAGTSRWAPTQSRRRPAMTELRQCWLTSMFFSTIGL
jgi:AbrB family looped-hinge helix DNA binding protein